jgi:putative ATPase
LKDVENSKIQSVPAHLKDASYKGAERLDHGKGYKYAHDFPGHFVSQEYMPQKVRYYMPTDIGFEAKIKQWLDKIRRSQDLE